MLALQPFAHNVWLGNIRNPWLTFIIDITPPATFFPFLWFILNNRLGNDTSYQPLQADTFGHDAYSIISILPRQSLMNTFRCLLIDFSNTPFRKFLFGKGVIHKYYDGFCRIVNLHTLYMSVIGFSTHRHAETACHKYN